MKVLTITLMLMLLSLMVCGQDIYKDALIRLIRLSKDEYHPIVLLDQKFNGYPTINKRYLMDSIGRGKFIYYKMSNINSNQFGQYIEFERYSFYWFECEYHFLKNGDILYFYKNTKKGYKFQKKMYRRLDFKPEIIIDTIRLKQYLEERRAVGI